MSRKLFPQEVKARLISNYIAEKNQDLRFLNARRSLPIYLSEAEKLLRIRRALR